ncbi:AAA family ATPase [Virgibacillus dakarensis]|nr:AAA family ATPase [Virgibacillus dakarensis]
MINKINIKDVATYDSEGIEIDLKKINYIFGSNGTGKTTISECLRNSHESPTCSIAWDQNRSNFDLFVYNRHFVRENFNIRNEIKGIFTLGKASSDTLKQIDDKNEEMEKYDRAINSLSDNFEKQGRKLADLKTYFRDRCWDLKLKYDANFKEAFTGLRNNRERFMEKCLKEAENNNGELYTYDELVKKVESVFKAPQEKSNTISSAYYDDSLEQNPIFQTKIIGKKDIDIASLISSLNISDWVQQGHKHMEDTNGICPFCQQELPINFKEKLDEYFDKTYTEQIRILNTSIENYVNNTIDVIEKCEYLKREDIPFINSEKIADLLDIINSAYKENCLLLERKKNEPSRTVQLSPLTDYFKQINSEIKKANLQIIEVNRVIDNIKGEKSKLINDIWRFIIEENKNIYEDYMKNYKRVDKALKGMEKGIERQIGYRNKIRQEVIQLQNQLTSVLPSINEINDLLKSFGFTNFQLAESPEKGNYRIVREDGADANETLSEGEKTFITFLYFYQLINGSNEQDKVNTARIIVIDDPISSLDSNILFIVGNLINGLKQKIRNNHSNFKQLIVLTHNVYFHKEISFNKGKGSQKLSDETFIILMKTKNISHIKEYDENPIKNSYELLWKELKENQNSITTPNIMRRILENYFKFFGSIDVNEIIEGFPDADKVVCNSLLSWSNDGSHHINDDLFVDSSQELTQKYFDVFRQIFINSNHESHFDMMMGVTQDKFEEHPMSNEAVVEVQLAAEQAAATQQ